MEYPIYQIEYLRSKVIQYKVLIPHSLYEKLKLEGKLKQIGEYFTDASPLFEAIATGILNCNGGKSPVKIIKDGRNSKWIN